MAVGIDDAYAVHSAAVKTSLRHWPLIRLSLCGRLWRRTTIPWRWII